MGPTSKPFSPGTDPGFALRGRTGLSTGKDLIWAARDPDGADAGTADARLLVVEPEFVSVLKATGRDVSTVSTVLRATWDSRSLALLTHTSQVRATAAHIAVTPTANASPSSTPSCTGDCSGPSSTSTNDQHHPSSDAPWLS